jgi:putative Holliday junction resolvase
LLEIRPESAQTIAEQAEELETDAMLAERGVRGERQLVVVDQAVAVEILQSWLDAQRRQTR